RLPVASAQLKSAILLAGLYAEGQTTVIEPAPSRDHTERMFRALGVEVETHGNTITLDPPEDLRAVDIAVPGDISSAAFFLVAGAIVPDSELTIRNVGVNPTRTGILDVLRDMGADISISNFRDNAEPVCDLTVKHSALRGVEIGGSIIPRLIDELPVIAVAAAFAEGETVIRDAQELKVKESNRIAAMVNELTRAGVDAEETEDGMIIRGGKTPRAASFETYGDHRIAMSLAVLALAAEGASRINDPDVVAISYPDFFDTLTQLGG
ncbi:MAG TPA: 3-phosphoshikimate 1-carboxyvinyltransferase, partial [Candidatus Agathobaculum merdigallinarum]|nr:3-phosphoshikimate 1-carboxyvinyltransferase [Candidatus Agathobaculum merdigallinarum]